MLEIERKFLVRTMPRNLAVLPFVEIHQGYLACERGRHVRVRRIGDDFWLTAKRRRGVGRDEETVALTAVEFARFWPLTEGRRLHKTRYRVPHGDSTIEIDIFNGPHVGLIVAEIEFPDAQSCGDFIPPAWLGEEVTHDPAYRNTTLAVAGFSLASLPKATGAFNPKAELLWHLISTTERERIIERAFCTKCRGSEVLAYVGSGAHGHRMVEGLCANCGDRLPRILKPSEPSRRTTNRRKAATPAADLRTRPRSRR